MGTIKIDNDKRKEWLRALRKFKQGIQVRSKLGVLTGYAQQVAAERKGLSRWNQPNWDDINWITLLSTSIRDDTYPPKLLIGFVQTAEVTFMNARKQPSLEKILAAVNKVCTKSSKHLRWSFGVFYME